MKPLNSGHPRIFKNLSVIERCPLLGGNLKKIVKFGTFCLLFKAFPLFGMSALGGFIVLLFHSELTKRVAIIFES